MKKFLVVATVLVASFAAVPATAAAASLSVDRVNCESGDTLFMCSAVVTGGVAPFRSHWEVINGTVTEEIDEFTASGPCSLGLKVKGTVTMTDAIGRTASGSGTTICKKVWPAKPRLR